MIKVTVEMPFSLFDEVVDSIGEDVYRLTRENVSRRSWGWTASPRGRGYTYMIEVSPEAARYIAGYLRSRSGLSAYYTKGRGEARRSENAGLRTAQKIEAQL